jgi:hypothetical protein
VLDDTVQRMLTLTAIVPGSAGVQHVTGTVLVNDELELMTHPIGAALHVVGRAEPIRNAALGSATHHHLPSFGLLGGVAREQAGT